MEIHLLVLLKKILQPYYVRNVEHIKQFDIVLTIR
jgi:hypothetical protein